MLKALTPSFSEVEFRGEPGGHQDGANRGFLRSDSLVAVLFVEGVDDCSLADLRHLERGAPPCSDSRICCEERLLPVERYLDGLHRLGARRVVVNAITGIPADAHPAPGDAEAIRAVLARPEMMAPTSPLCAIPGWTSVFPSPRLTRMVADCPGGVWSMCDPRLPTTPDGQRELMREIGSSIARAACHPE